MKPALEDRRFNWKDFMDATQKRQIDAGTIHITVTKKGLDVGEIKNGDFFYLLGMERLPR